MSGEEAAMELTAGGVFARAGDRGDLLCTCAVPGMVPRYNAAVYTKDHAYVGTAGGLRGDSFYVRPGEGVRADAMTRGEQLYVSASEMGPMPPRDGGGRGRDGGGRGRGGGFAGHAPHAERDPPADATVCGVFTRAGDRGDLFCTCAVPGMVPRYNAPLYTKNKTYVGATGGVRGDSFIVRPGAGVRADAMTRGEQLYVSASEMGPMPSMRGGGPRY
jgi:rRNA processing protein Gar1